MRVRALFAAVVAVSGLVGASVGTAAAAAHETAATSSVTRYSGIDRFATGAAIVDANYKPGVPVVYIATGLNFPDALAGGAAAAEGGGPLLLVQPDAIPAPIVTELSRLTPGKIVILGGTLSVSAAVQTQLQTYTSGTVTRVAGDDRYATAAALAATFPAGSPVYLATGVNYPDALAATAAAAAKHAAILLTDPATLPTETAAALAALKPSSITIVGSTDAVSASIATAVAAYSSTVVRISGADRYATAAAIAKATFPTATGVFITSGLGFADALTGGPLAGTLGEPLLLSAPSCLPEATATEVTSLAPNTVTLLGGTAALADRVGALDSCEMAIGPPATQTAS
jgi:putative cell wall-binding protein